MRRLVFTVLLLPLCSVQALEYLSDDELETLDGYTSEAMVKEYDSEGNVIFRRGDNEACRYAQSDANDDARAKCEEAFEEDADAILAQSFQRYLDQSLALMTEVKQLDEAGDNLLDLDLFVRLEDFSYNHFMCVGEPSAGVIHFEGMSLIGPDGGDVNIRTTTSIKQVRNTNTGEDEQSVVIKMQPLNGQFSIKAIRLGNSEDNAENGGSIGRLQSKFNVGQVEISRIED